MSVIIFQFETANWEQRELEILGYNILLLELDVFIYFLVVLEVKLFGSLTFVDR